jgi:aconitate hydratase
MGVLPLEFINGETRKTYNIDGTETYDVAGDIASGGTMSVLMTRTSGINPGEVVTISVKCRLDTAEEVSVYNAGGVLQKFAQDFLQSNA